MILARIGDFVRQVIIHVEGLGYKVAILDNQVRQIIDYTNPNDSNEHVLSLSLSRDDADILITDRLKPGQFFWHVNDYPMYAYFPAHLNSIKSLNNLILASGNQGKVVEFERFFEQGKLCSLANYSSELLALLDSTEETGATFIENALIKSQAVAAASQSKICVLADDSGFCLSGVDWGEFPQLNVKGADAGIFPGVFTKRFVSAISPKDHNYADAFDWISDHCGSIKPAFYECSLGLTLSGDLLESVLVSGQVQGDFIMPPRYGDHGFGFDPVFRPENQGRTYSQMTSDEKAADSHRSRAVQNLKALFAR